MQPYIDAIVAFVQANQAWAAPVAFVLAFGESLAFVSLFLPSTVILVAIGGLLGAGTGTDRVDRRHCRLDRRIARLRPLLLDRASTTRTRSAASGRSATIPT